MALPKFSSAYPSEFLAVLEKVLTEGEFIIPTSKPDAMRFRFYGLLTALRTEGKTQAADAIGLYIQAEPSALIVRLRELEPMTQDITAALGGTSPTPEKDESIARINALFDSLLSGGKP